MIRRFNYSPFTAVSINLSVQDSTRANYFNVSYDLIFSARFGCGPFNLYIVVFTFNDADLPYSYSFVAVK